MGTVERRTDNNTEYTSFAVVSVISSTTTDHKSQLAIPLLTSSLPDDALSSIPSSSPTVSSGSAQLSFPSTPATTPEAIIPDSDDKSTLVESIIPPSSSRTKSSSLSLQHVVVDPHQVRPLASPLFPSPSSSFRPSPDVVGDVTGEERLLTRTGSKVKGRRTLSVDLAGVFRGSPHPNLDSVVIPPTISRPDSVCLSRSNSNVSRSNHNTISRRARSGSVASSRTSPRIDHEIFDQSSHHPAHIHSSLSTVVGSLSCHISKPVSPILLSSSSPIMSLSASTSSVIVRDFAFERLDPRFTGLPHPDATRKRPSSGSSATSRRSEDETLAEGGSVFSWGFVTCHQTDFPVESDGSQEYSNEEAEEGQDCDDEEGDGIMFTPGLYEALFDFEPELDTEMRIKAGEVVTVFARKCAGWVQAGRVAESDTVAEVGLVPENYLALLEPADVDAWGDEEEEAHPAADDDKARQSAEVASNEVPPIASIPVVEYDPV